VVAPGGVGTGGAYAGSGFGGENFFIGARVPPRVPGESGGDSGDLGLDDDARELNPDLGYLRGGSGGGGGAAHLLQTRVDGQVLNNCMLPINATLEVADFVAHSGASGGSGGGGVQLQAGRRLVINGEVLAPGGNGGGAVATTLAQPGGGGSGGSILLQSTLVQISSIPGRIDVQGGLGGFGFDTQSALNGRAIGGIGGPGIIRLESFPPIPTVATEVTKILPTEEQLRVLYGQTVGVSDIFTTAEWQTGGLGASSYSGAQSCWFSERDLVDPSDPTRDIENVFELQFNSDGAELGWDMMLKLSGFAALQSYRGENDLTGPGGMSLEELWGNQLDDAPVIVRFQGGKSSGALSQPCSVALTGLDSPLIPGSLTGWVEKPEDLNGYNPNAALGSNAFRFTIIYNANDPDFPLIEEIDEVIVRAKPD